MAHGRHKPKQEEEAGEGAPLWIISFADMMSLLMAFFVMLSTFSGFGPSEAEKLQKAVDATLAPNYRRLAQAAVPNRRRAPSRRPPDNSKKAAKSPPSQETQGKGLMKETPAGDFRTRKIFLVESKTVFWGAGTTLSPSGRDFLDTLASFAAKMPDRIVISESGPGRRRGRPSNGLSLRRARPRGPELPGRQGISKDRCSIAVRGMSPDRSFETQRMLEIVLLASVYQ